MPIVAEAYYKQISGYFEQHADVQLSSGQICYEAVAAEEPAGKHIALAKKVSCRLKLNDVDSRPRSLRRLMGSQASDGIGSSD